MESLLAALNARCSTRAHAQRLAVLFGIIAAVLAAAGVALAIMDVPYIPVLAGSLAGALLYFSGYLAITRLLPPDMRAKIDFRGRLALPQRRFVALWLVIGWVLIVLFALRPLESTGVIIGALNVTFALFVWRFGSSTPEEQDELQRLYDEEEEERAEQAQQWSDEGNENEPDDWDVDEPSR